MSDQPTHGDLRDLLTRLDAKMEAGFAAVHLSIGEPSSDGKGGSGIWGEVKRTQNDVAGLLDMKKQGVGFVAAVALFATLIILGIKGWVQGLFA